MGGIAFTALCLASLGQAPAAPQIGSYLYQPTYVIDRELRGPARAYQIQPGDIVFAADGKLFWKITHHMAGTGNPTHSAIAFRRPDGTMAILEAGPHDTRFVRTLDALPHLQSYEVEGRVWIRARAVPLTKEQSDRLTEFALLQDGKPFATKRLGQQIPPFMIIFPRARGPLRTSWFADKPHGPDRESFFCSELVMESLAYTGLVDYETTRPTATYPRDIFKDRSLNPYLNRHLNLAPCWDPPARWTSGLTEGCLR